MRQLPLYPKTTPTTAPINTGAECEKNAQAPPSNPLRVIHRRIISPIALKLILFILMIARALPGGRSRSQHPCRLNAGNGLGAGGGERPQRKLNGFSFPQPFPHSDFVGSSNPLESQSQELFENSTENVSGISMENPLKISSETRMYGESNPSSPLPKLLPNPPSTSTSTPASRLRKNFN